MAGGGAGNEGALPLTELNEPLPELNAPVRGATGAAGTVDAGSTDEVAPALAGDDGGAGTVDAAAPAVAGGGGETQAVDAEVPAVGDEAMKGLADAALATAEFAARTATLAGAVPAPDGAATAESGVPLETELNPCACAKPSGAMAASASANRKSFSRLRIRVIRRESYSSREVLAVRHITLRLVPAKASQHARAVLRVRP
ncbi:MAG: hypothetical protein WBM03_00985 [Steroidobacteraceae bacterium]